MPRPRLLRIAIAVTLAAGLASPILVGHGIDGTTARAAPEITPRPDTTLAAPPNRAPSGPERRTEPDRIDGRRARMTVRARTTQPSLEPGMVRLATWTVRYVVGPENGRGANIDIPLRRLDGVVIQPGATFDFWTAVGEVSRRTGYRRGAVIVGNRVDPDGALAGGICTVSTAVFNAAARAGLQILARRAHGGYLAKYPLGLDAAVSKGDGSRQTVAFRNDTAEPIRMRTASSPGVARVDLYAAAATGRQVTFSEPAISRRVAAHDRRVVTTSIRGGERRRVQPSSDGMTVSIRRTVRDATGRILSSDRWVSRYRPLDGLVLVGRG